MCYTKKVISTYIFTFRYPQLVIKIFFVGYKDFNDFFSSKQLGVLLKREIAKKVADAKNRKLWERIGFDI